MLKKKELLLISHLRRNSRETLTRISKKTKIPISTIFDKLKKYEADNIIAKNTALLNFNVLGYHARATILLGINKKDRESLSNFLKKEPRANSVSRINNGYDFMIDGIFKDIKELHEFIEKIEEEFDVENKEIHFIIDDIKREEFLSNPNYLELFN